MTNQRQTSTLEAARASLSPEEKKRRLINAAFYALCLVLGVAFGFINNPSLNELMNFIASVFTRLFSFIAVPIIALALISTLAKLGKDSSSGRIFKQTIFYTLATTIVAVLYFIRSLPQLMCQLKLQVLLILAIFRKPLI